MTGIDFSGAFGQGVIGPFLVSWVIDKIKHSSLPGTKWLTPDASTQLVTMLRAFTALANSAGILWVWDPTGGVLTISGLTLSNAAGAAGIILQNYVLQDVFDMKFTHGRAQAATIESKETPK